MGIEFNHVSIDAQTRLTEFKEDFALALSQETNPADDWARNLGLHITSKSLKTKFPVPISAAGYKEFEGDVRYRSLFEKSLEIVPKTWQDGVKELASIVEAPDFIGWAGQAEAMASAARSLPNEIVAALLEGGTSAVCWDDQFFFDTDHPVNLLDSALSTFANTFSGAGTAASASALETAKKTMRSIKASNGKYMGLRLTHIACSPAKEETWRNILERDLIIESNGSNNFGTVSNRHKGTVGLIVIDQLTSDAPWFALGLNKPGMYPWIVQDAGTPETITHDKSSNLYTTTLNVGVASILRGNGALALPHCIHRYAGA